MIELSIIVVNYRADDLVEELRASIKLKKNWEFIVVDNSKVNRGFARGCNEGARQSKGKYLIFINPDSLVHGDALKKMLVKIQQKKDVGVIGPQLVDEKGQPYLSFAGSPSKVSAPIILSFLDRILPSNRYSKEYWYKNMSLDKERSVGSVSGAALMIRRKDFEDLGGFDERMFMYWEDADLCARSKSSGKKILYYPEAKITHYRAKSTPKESWKVRSWFRASRYRFFLKHFGRWYAILLELWLLLTEEWRFVAIVGLAAYLRFSQLPELMPLIFDQGRDMLAAVEALNTKQLPLLGIPSSVPRFRQGPIYIWLLMAVFGTFGTDPVFAAIVASVVGLVVVGVVYLITERWWGRSTASVAALILATSPLAVAQSRLAFHTNPIPLISTMLIILLAMNKRTKYHFLLLGLTFGLLFQFELAVFPLLALVIWKVILVSKENILRNLIYAGLGGLMALMPQVIWDVGHNFSQLGLFGAWVGYRIVSFFGFDKEHVVGRDKISGYIESLYTYGSRYISPTQPWGFWLILLLLVLGMIYFFPRLKKLANKPIYWVNLWLVVVVLGFFVHGKPSEAYFPVLFVPTAMSVAYVWQKLRKPFKPLVLLLILILAMINTSYLIKTDFLMNTKRSNEIGLNIGYGLPLRSQLEIVRLMKVYANNQPISLTAFGPGTEHESFLDNYKFLLKVNGVKLESMGRPMYLLFGEEAQQLDFLNALRFRFNGVHVVIIM